MKQQLTSDVPPDDTDLEADYDSPTDDVAGLVAMLADAYDAPLVPKSLVQRVDDGIGAQWGRSPGLVPKRFAGVVSVARFGRACLRPRPIGVGLAASLVLAFIFGGGSGNYAWASVVDAIKRHGLIQINSGAGVRWLDLSNLVAGEQTNGKTQWIDLRKRIVVTRSAPSNTLRREPLTASNGSSQDEALLVVFLLGQPLSAESIDRFGGAKIVDQQWNKQSDNGRDTIELRVSFQTASDEEFSLSMRLDPDSKLPLAVQKSESNAPTQFVALTYPRESTEDLQAIHIEANTSIDTAANDLANQIATGALLDQDLNEIQPDKVDRLFDLGFDSVPEPNSDHSISDSDKSEGRDPSVASLPIGAANKWAPVAVVPRPETEVLRRVDAILEELWAREGVHPVTAATDLQLLRRAYLDLAGRTPTVNEVRRYMKDNASDRYERLIETLLESPDHSSQMAAVWRSFLIPEGVDLDAFGGREAFEKWLANRFEADEPYDQIVRKLLLAEGRLSQSGPLLFYTALKLDAHQLASRTSRVFLGMRLECAQCHDHPFEPWKQEDFWSYAAFFAQISRPKTELENVSTVMRVRDVDRGDVMLPETDTIVAPRFLGEVEQADNADQLAPATARRQRLATWLAGPNNPYFARATVNRVWGQLFGRGIVDPVDDFGVNHQPVSPELLDTLASQFIDSHFDLKTLIRTIALSRAYRLSSSSSDLAESEAEVEKRLKTFAQMTVNTLTAEQLYDCITVATMLDQDNNPSSDYTLSRFGNSQREMFLQQFATPTANRAEYLAGIPQALMLMNGSLISGATGEDTSGLIRSLEAPFFTDRQRIDVLVMATLSRPASPEELKLVADFVPVDASPAERSAGLADLLWALINSAEFTLNH